MQGRGAEPPRGPPWVGCVCVGGYNEDMHGCLFTVLRQHNFFIIGSIIYQHSQEIKTATAIVSREKKTFPQLVAECESSR